MITKRKMLFQPMQIWLIGAPLDQAWDPFPGWTFRNKIYFGKRKREEQGPSRVVACSSDGAIPIQCLVTCC